MKKKLVVYLAGLLTVLGLGFGQAQFSDVPAGHWAKEAVERIAACGLITGFPDGTFRGNQNLTRYQAALIFQRLLNEIQQGGECVKGQGQGGGLSDEDLTAIRNAVQELAAELAALGVRVSALEDNAASKDDIARLEAAIEELKAMRAEPGMEPTPGLDEAALADLADRVEAASVAADT
ncbi:MAG: S-layer homology domain-containing protein, partial [Meiothermus sp.]|uniref:S-layer homology domain-containing protein n=1 Tax=Meiothermus sp. TaxID=1955249 RepID=UPI0028CE392D